MNVEWGVRHDLVTPLGTITMNVRDPDTGRVYLLLPDGYKLAPTLRVTQDNLSEADGSFLHPSWKSGAIANLHVRYCIQPQPDGDLEPACAGDLRQMHEQLTAALDSIRGESGQDQRLIWSPSPTGTVVPSRRMLEDVQTLAWTEPSWDEPYTEVTFSVDSPFPYALDLTQEEVEIDDATETIYVDGTSRTWPVLSIAGPCSSFSISTDRIVACDGSPLALVYDASRPGAIAIPSGHFAEIDTFKGTIFLDGNSTDLTAGLDPGGPCPSSPNHDFFPLLPGANSITTDCDALILFNPAWS